MFQKISDALVKVIAGIIRGWRKLGRSVRILILCGAAVIVVAAVVVPLVFTSLAHAAEPAVAEATPALTPTAPPVVTPSPTPVPTTPAESAQDITLQYGDQNEAVTALQNRLMDLGYLDLDEPTDYFGPATKSALELFQRQHELTRDGIATYQVQALLYSDEAQNYTITLGTTGDDVTAVQRQLIDLGYLASGHATGYYGDMTTEAVKAFQKANSLTVDGLTGTATLDRLYSPNAIATPERRAAIRERANIEKMISTAEDQLGDPYVGGAEGPNSFDCSGLVYYCLKAAGSNRGRYNAQGYSQVSDWKKVSWSELKRGDLMFFWSSSKGKVGHVAIYIGGGMVIDASSSHGKVVKRSCTGNWWRSNFVWGRRPW